jgi:wyosine [tRNA(Phe)-imidazoG37] synthetase (radical SAM superfamily)
VYRLTLVNEWNNEEIENYAELIGRGLPDFIEVKVIFIGSWSICHFCYSDIFYD